MAKQTEQQIIDKFRRGGELGLSVSDCCVYVGVSRETYNRKKAKYKAAIDEGRAKRMHKVYAPDVYAQDRINKRTEYLREHKTEACPIDEDEMATINLAHRFAMEERRHEARLEGLRISREELKHKKQMAEKGVSMQDIVAYIPTARAMTEEEERKYAAEDYPWGDDDSQHTDG